MRSIAEIRVKLKREQRKLQQRKLMSHRGLMFGGIVIFFMIIISIFAPILTPYDPYTIKTVERLLPPSGVNLIGTDEFGRDLLTRVLYGARVSVIVGFSVALFSSFLGLVIGIYASYYRILDNIFMRICDGLVAIPGILLAIALMAALGASVWNVIIALTIVYTPNIARIVRASALVVKEQPYVESVIMQGAGQFRVIWLNIAPNIVSPLLVQSTFVFASAILSEAALSFLGAGIPPPEPSWGNILQASKLVLSRAWWMAAFPGAMIVLSVMSLNLLGDGLRDYFDPRIK